MYITVSRVTLILLSKETFIITHRLSPPLVQGQLKSGICTKDQELPHYQYSEFNTSFERRNSIHMVQPPVVLHFCIYRLTLSEIHTNLTHKYFSP